MNHLGLEAAADWLALAESDRQTAESLQNTKPHIACYLSQQAAEKAVKALYVAHNVPFAFTHSIAELIDGLADQYPPLSAHRSAGVILTLYEVNTRYINLQTGINPLKEFRPEDARHAVGLATGICEACQQIYGQLVQGHTDTQT